MTNQGMAMVTAPTRTPAHLCEEIFTFIITLKTVDTSGRAATYEGAERLLDTLEREVGQAGFAPDKREMITFAVAAFIEEIVATSNWLDRARVDFLQDKFLHTAYAGARFFECLRTLHGYLPPPEATGLAGDPEGDTAVWMDSALAGPLEIYYTCLLLGFRGVLGLPFAQPYVSQYLDVVRGHGRRKAPGPLSPHGLPWGARRRAPRLSGWMWAAITVEMLAIAGIVLLFWPGS